MSVRPRDVAEAKEPALSNAERALGAPPGQFYASKMGTTHYMLEGDYEAPLVVLACAMEYNLVDFDALAAGLLEAGFQVLRYDYFDRGWSSSSREFQTEGAHHELDFTPGVYVEQVEELLKHITLDDVDVVWIGHGMGGAVGIDFIAKYSDQARGVVLIDSEGLPVRRSLMSLMGDALCFNDCMMGHFGTSALRTRVTQSFGDDEKAREAQLDLVDKQLQENPRFHASLCSTIRNFPFGGFRSSFTQLCEAKVPVLLVWGTLDTLIPVQNCEDFEDMANGADNKVTKELITAPHALPMMEGVREQLVKAVVDFLRGGASHIRLKRGISL